MEKAMQKSSARLQSVYADQIIPRLMARFGYSSRMAVPRIVKVTLNMGVGEAVSDRKVVEAAMADMAKIAGQKPVVTRARKSVAGFKIREGWPIGCKVTLRRERMYEFLDRLVNVALPRIRDFRGLSRRSFDGRGNYSLGIREQIVFPEIDYDRIDALRGLDVVISTSAGNDEEGQALLEGFNFPFRK
jgi:large subunit ribosomal protein L5